MKRKSILMLFLVVALASVAMQPAKKVVKKGAKASNDTISVVMKQAQDGDAAAQNTLAQWYYTGKDTLKQDYRKAYTWWAHAAQQGNIDAVASLAVCTQKGQGTQKDSLTAVKLYKKAIAEGRTDLIKQHEDAVKKNNSMFSARLLQEVYGTGIGVKADKEKADVYQDMIAEVSDSAVQYKTALAYLNEKKADKAFPWFKKAASKGHVGANYYTAYLTFNGMGTTQDKETAIKLYKMAGKNGFTMANARLAQIYFDGDGAEKDEVKAFEHARIAAYDGKDDARWLLGLCYLNGIGTAQDYYLATQWLVESASRTHRKEMDKLLADDNNGTYTLYLQGLRKFYVEKDYTAAMDLFKKVEKAKNVEGTVMQAMCMREDGYEKKNEKKCVKMLEKVAGKSAVATYYLSVMYERGEGCAKNEAKAVELLNAAAEAGVGYAQCKLADRYMKGNGVPVDYTKAAKLYIAAEAQGRLTSESAKNLAECYQKKINALPDLDKAELRIQKLQNMRVNGNLITFLTRIDN